MSIFFESSNHFSVVTTRRKTWRQTHNYTRIRESYYTKLKYLNIIIKQQLCVDKQRSLSKTKNIKHLFKYILSYIGKIGVEWIIHNIVNEYKINDILFQTVAHPCYYLI
jgi:hypothetical protein